MRGGFFLLLLVLFFSSQWKLLSLPPHPKETNNNNNKKKHYSNEWIYLKKKKSRTTDGLHKNFTSHLNFQLFLWLPYLQWWNRVVHNVHIPEESETKATSQHFFWVMIMEWVYWMQIRCWWSLKMSFSDQLHQII